MRHLLLALSVTTLAACGAPAPVAPAQPAATAPTAAGACAGTVDAKDGLKEVDDPALLKQALGDPGKGGVCTGKVFEAVKPLTVYRVYDKAQKGSPIGRWWSLSKPQGPADTYRAANEICLNWTKSLDTVIECKIKPGTHVAVGPGQSATCTEGPSYPTSPTNQVFINNDTRDPANPKLLVDGCTPGASWP